MASIVKNIGIGLIVLATSLYSNSPSWTADVPAIYWFGEEDHPHTLERGYDTRDNPTATSGTATTVDEFLDRSSGNWVSYASVETDYDLNISSGEWVTRGSTYQYNITGNNNEIMEAYDGYARLDGIVDIAGEAMPFSACYGFPTELFQSGAKRYNISWKGKEQYSLQWYPQDWSTDPATPYSSLDAFMSSDITFLHNNQTGEMAGFRENADINDGSGELVVITWESGRQEGRVVGDWDADYTLPGQTINSIKFNITDNGFLDDDEDFKFATVHDGKVWIGTHSPARTDYVQVNDPIYNEEAYNELVAVAEAHKAELSQLITCDLIDTRHNVQYDNMFPLDISYFGNMNYIGQIDNNGELQTVFSGTWSVQNGVILTDKVSNDVNKTIGVNEIDFNAAEGQARQITRTEAGRGTFNVKTGETWPIGDTPETIIGHRVTYADIKNKKFSITYTDSEGSGTADIFLFPNMTYAVGNSGEDVGVWKIENGVIVVDSYWINDDGSIGKDAESWVFSDSAHIMVYINNSNEVNITINTENNITDTDNIPTNFTIEPVDHPFTVDQISNQVITVGTPNDTNNQDKLYFYPNMTFKQETHDDEGNPETITGIWSVVEGVIVVDIVYSDTASSHLIITDNGDGTVDAMEVVAGDTSRDEDIPVLDSSEIPAETPVNSVSPAVIMYLLN